MEYAPTDPDVLDDPFPAYERLRAECPVHRTEALGPPLYSLSRADDVHAALVDHDLWSNRHGPGIQNSSGGTGDMQHDDRPVHTTRRLFVRDWFRPDAIARLEPSIQAITAAQLDRLAPLGRADLYADLALPLPVTSFCEIMGIEITERSLFLEWADEMVTAMAYPERGRDARRSLSAFTRAELADRRQRHADGLDVPPGLLSHLATEVYDDGEPMPIDEAVNMSNQLLIAGHETTTSLITNCVWRLLDVPTRWQRLVEQPELIPNAIEESLRYDAPVLGLCRTNNRDTTIDGVDIEADSKVMMLYASANRDPARFDRPDDFIVDRPLRELAKHYSFSWGVHHCLGAHLARLTARTMLAQLIERFPTLRVAGASTRVASPFLWGRKSLPVEWDIAG